MKKYKNIINFYNEYIKLEQIIRKGWLMNQVPAKRLESVADHTLQLLMLASVTIKELNLEFDQLKLMEMLLIHDVGEAIIGDISEKEPDRELKKQNEKEAVYSIFNNLKEANAEYYYSLWLEMENKTTELAKFAYLLDKIDAVIKARIYEEEYSVENLFDEFYNHQKQKGIFKNSILEEFYEYIMHDYIENKR